MVAERESMRPITVFRPYQEEVSSILALPFQEEGKPCLVTVGRGYRSLIDRFKNENAKNDAHLMNDIFAILWSCGHWAF